MNEVDHARMLPHSMKFFTVRLGSLNIISLLPNMCTSPNNFFFAPSAGYFSGWSGVFVRISLHLRSRCRSKAHPMQCRCRGPRGNISDPSFLPLFSFLLSSFWLKIIVGNHRISRLISDKGSSKRKRGPRGWKPNCRVQNWSTHMSRQYKTNEFVYGDSHQWNTPS